MDQNALLNDEIEGGRRLIEAVAAAGFEVTVAFWAKASDERQWYLYLASPLVDEQGPVAGYGIVQPVVQRMPELGIHPLGVKVVGLNDGTTQDVLAALRSRVFAVRGYRGMTRFTGNTLGGIEMDAAFIYPPPEPAPAM